MLQGFLLLGREVVDGAVVEDPPATVNSCVPHLVDLIRKAKSWLEGSEESRAPRAVGEVSHRIERLEEKRCVLCERVVDIPRCHVAVVQHVALIIPADADVERQPRRQVPVILKVCTDLGVARVVVRVPQLEFEVLRNVEAVRIGCDEQRILRVALEDVVREEVDAHAGFDHVLATLIEP